MSNDIQDSRLAMALARYQAISAYLADPPKRGQKRAYLEKLAQKTWTGPDGKPIRAAVDTMRVWIRRYRLHGLEGLMDKRRPTRPQKRKLTGEQRQLITKLKREVPERSVDRIIGIAEKTQLVEPDLLKRSTVHRVLQQEGISARKARVPDAHDLDRFEADSANDLWQSDMLVGPYLPDPERGGKTRRTYLYLFMDDQSRLILHGRFSFKGDLPALELVFRRALQKYGVCKRVYYDNAQTYRSHHMQHITAALGIHRIVFTTPYRPMGHGKIEALNGYIRNAFLAELKASRIKTLDGLNEAFCAFADYEYNKRNHGETGQTPWARWHENIEKIRYVDEETLRNAFLWREQRTPDKTGVFSLFGTRYQVEPKLARRRVEVRYDPEEMSQVEVWHNGRFVQRVSPFAPSANRRPKPTTEPTPTPTEESPPATVDWLTHLVQRRRKEAFIEPSPRQLTQKAHQDRERKDQAIVDLLAHLLDEAVMNEREVREYLQRFGPFDVEAAEITVQCFIDTTSRTDHHIRFYLDLIRSDQGGDQ